MIGILRGRPAQKPSARFAVAVTLALATIRPTAAQLELGGHWQSLFTPAGPAGPIETMTAYGRLLIAGGSFPYADDVPVANIAAWDGNRWSPLGGGLDGNVSGMAVDGQHLYVVGSFQRAGSLPSSGFAFWDGSAWRTHGDGTTRWFTSVALHQGQVYVGAISDDVQGLYKWSGQAWERCGAAMSGEIDDLVSDGRRLWLKGNFSVYDELGPVAGIGYWDGKNFRSAQRIGDGIAGHSLAVLDGAMYDLGPSENPPQGRREWVLRRWTDFGWEPLPFPPEMISEPRLASDPDSGKLFVSGHDGVDRALLAEWKDSAFAIVGGHPSAYAYPVFSVQGKAVSTEGFILDAGSEAGNAGATLSLRPISAHPQDRLRGQAWKMAASGSDLLLYGGFSDGGPGARIEFARLQPGKGWTLLPTRLGADTAGSSLSFQTMLAFGEEQYLAGSFDSVDGIAAENIAHWNGKAWSALGKGYPGFPQAMIKGGEGILVAGHGHPAGPLHPEFLDWAAAARWDGKAWQPMGAGLLGEAACVAEHGGMTYFGGHRLRIGGAGDTIAFARWTGEEWQTAADKVDSMKLVRVRQLASTPHGLYAVVEAQEFVFSPEVKAYLARLEGRTFTPIRPLGINPRILSDSTRLFVWSGSPSHSSIDAGFLKIWDGNTWHDAGHPAGIPFENALYDMAVLGGYLYVAHSPGPRDFGLSFLRWDIQAGSLATRPPQVKGPARRSSKLRHPAATPAFPGPKGGFHDARGRRLRL